ncbi:hypothetical protein RIR_e22295_A0A2N1NAF8_9GLOM [Rhizophagus irregularis DAOM 181602=DAOM 197198]|nr:hypothetical protein RIR_e22295_A0A2N1NAF8_9GLOM [Rhizophagus irregularis DAOM 181602=DAOM 197198]
MTTGKRINDTGRLLGISWHLFSFCRTVPWCSSSIWHFGMNRFRKLIFRLLNTHKNFILILFCKTLGRFLLVIIYWAFIILVSGNG